MLQKRPRKGQGKKKEERLEEQAEDGGHAEGEAIKENLPPMNSQAHPAAQLPGRSFPKTPCKHVCSASHSSHFCRALLLRVTCYLCLHCSFVEGRSLRAVLKGGPTFVCRLRAVCQHLRPLSASSLQLMVHLPKAVPAGMALAPHAYLLSGLLDATKRHLSSKPAAPFSKAQHSSQSGDGSVSMCALLLGQYRLRQEWFDASS